MAERNDRERAEDVFIFLANWERTHERTRGLDRAQILLFNKSIEEMAPYAKRLRNYYVHNLKQPLDPSEILLVDFDQQVSAAHRRFQSKRTPKITNPPGARISGWLDVLVGRKNFERIFQEMIADMRDEYFQALSAGRRRLAWWIRVRFYLSVGWALILLASGVAELIRAISKS